MTALVILNQETYSTKRHFQVTTVDLGYNDQKASSINNI